MLLTKSLFHFSLNLIKIRFVVCTLMRKSPQSLLIKSQTRQYLLKNKLLKSNNSNHIILINNTVLMIRWYRCPELLLAPNRPYNEAIDMWAVGCILAELLRRKPLFPGKSHANQVQLIFEVIGYSSSQNLGFEVC